jgi:glycosyltransferase involved in cell wall biosynthesis
MSAGKTQEFRILMVARLDTIKDHPTLLKAFAIVRRARPSVVLELAGDGPRKSALRELANSLNISDAVRFHGVVSDIHSLIAQSDLFVFSTTRKEGLGNALVEAMLVGTPCVATDVGPCREFVTDGRELKLVPPRCETALANAIIELIDDADERASRAVEGQRFAERKFCASTFARQYADCLGL